MMSPGVYLLFSKCWFFWVVVEGGEGGGEGAGESKRTEDGPKWQKILSKTLHISGTIYHMIVIYGTLL